MHNLHIPSHIITKRRMSLLAIAFTAIALLVTNLGLTRPASALECVRAPHTVTITPETANQSATPGTTLWYDLEITNNDSAGCGLSDFTFDGANIPADWTVYPYQGTVLVDGTEITPYSMSYTSGAHSYNGTYSFEIEVFRAEEPTVVKIPVTYTVYGGQDIPTPDSYPIVSLTSPAANSTVTTGTNVTLSANARDDRGVTNLSFLVNGNLLCSGTANTCQWTVPNAPGTYNLQVRATDTIGQVSTASHSVTAVAPPDTTKPVVSITSPMSNATVKKNSTVVIQAIATDNVGVTKVEFYVNGNLLCTGTATSCSWVVPNTKATHTLTVKAYDAAGNVSTATASVLSR